MTDIFREVEEDIRRERLMKLWNRFGPAIIGIVTAVVLGTGGYVLWRNYQADAVEQAAGSFLAAAQQLESDRPVAVAALGRIAADGPDGYRTLAKLTEAAAVALSGDRAKAIALYDEVAARETDPLIGGAARLRAAMLLADTLPAAALRERLGPALTEASPWRYSARELVAVAELQGGNRGAAEAEFAALAADPGAPDGLRRRAESILAQLRTPAPPPPAPIPTPDTDPALNPPAEPAGPN